MDHPSRLDAMFALFDACQKVESRTTFIDEIRPRLQAIIPHQRFLCGIASVTPMKLLEAINAGFPDAFVLECVDGTGRITSPLVRQWLALDAPVFFDAGDEASVSALQEQDRAWLARVRQHQMGTMAAHGIKDLHGGATSYFCFAGVPARDAQLEHDLRLVVPHLHTALRSHYQLKAVRNEPTLSAREREVLQLVCVGKTNDTIGQILGISAWTVKVHVRHIMAKLNVSTRGHAAARAVQEQLVDR